MTVSTPTNPGDREIHQMLINGKVLDQNESPSENYNELKTLIYSSIKDIQTKIREILKENNKDIPSNFSETPELDATELVKLLRFALEHTKVASEIRDLLKQDTTKTENGTLLSFPQKQAS